jgi:hypothetical protein
MKTQLWHTDIDPRNMTSEGPDHVSVIVTTECMSNLYLVPRSHTRMCHLMEAHEVQKTQHQVSKKGGGMTDPPPVPEAKLQVIRVHIPENCAVIFNQNLLHAGADYVDDNLCLHFYVDFVKSTHRALSFYGLKWTLRRWNIPPQDHHKYFGCGDYFDVDSDSITIDSKKRKKVGRSSHLN